MAIDLSFDFVSAVLRLRTLVLWGTLEGHLTFNLKKNFFTASGVNVKTEVTHPPVRLPHFDPQFPSTWGRCSLGRLVIPLAPIDQPTKGTPGTTARTTKIMKLAIN